MKVIKEGKDKITFQEECVEEDGDKVKNLYTVVDMGPFIFSKEFNAFSSIPKAWRLMFWDQEKVSLEGKKKVMHVECACDAIEFGEKIEYYSRMTFNIDNIERDIYFKNGEISDDTIYDLRESSANVMSSIDEDKIYIKEDNNYVRKTNSEDSIKIPYPQDYLIDAVYVKNNQLVEIIRKEEKKI